jgi:ABC-2 type transport system permease protein
MSLKRSWTLFKTEVFHGPRGSILVMSLLTPIIIALFVNLAFGNIFSGRAKLGVYDQGDSRLANIMQENGGVTVKSYDSETGLKDAARRGAVDMGIILPSGLDSAIKSGTVSLTAYVWGESLAKNRTIIPAVLADSLHELAGMSVPVTIETVPLGDTAGLPWSDRLLPLVVLTAVFFGGMMLPAASLINEKQRRTLLALNVTPATLGDIFTAKGVIGVLMAFVMGVLTLAFSAGLGALNPLLLLVLGLGAILAAEIGLITGAFIKDINSLFAFWKFGGLLLYGPAVVYMFPQIPAWVGYIFPTYYVIQPVLDLSVNGLGFSAIALNVVILAAIVAVMGLALRAVINRLSTQALSLS